MHMHCVEESNYQRFLDLFLPGPEPAPSDLGQFYYPETEESGTHDLDVKVDIVRGHLILSV